MIVTYERNVLVAFILRNLFYLVFFFFLERFPRLRLLKLVDRYSLYSKMYNGSKKMWSAYSFGRNTSYVLEYCGTFKNICTLERGLRC